MLKYCLWIWEILFGASPTPQKTEPVEEFSFPFTLSLIMGSVGWFHPHWVFLTLIKWVLAFPEWLMYRTYLPPPRRAIMQKGMDDESIHIYSDTYSMIFHVCDHQETYGTYYKKWRLEVTATLGKFKIALLSRWVKNSWSIQKGSMWGAQVFHCEKVFTVTKCTNISLLGEMLACVWPHTVQGAKADCRNRIFLSSILNTPPVSQSPSIQFEPWGQVSHKHPARWEGITLTCSEAFWEDLRISVPPPWLIWEPKPSTALES